MSLGGPSDSCTLWIPPGFQIRIKPRWAAEECGIGNSVGISTPTGQNSPRRPQDNWRMYGKRVTAPGSRGPDIKSLTSGTSEASGYQVLTFGLTCHQGCDKLSPEGGLLEKV